MGTVSSASNLLGRMGERKSGARESVLEEGCHSLSAS